MASSIDQWTAGELVLRVIARWMIDEGDTRKIREFIEWLEPGDVVKTEHVIILGNLRTLDSAGGELSRERLESAIAPYDPAEFVRMTWDSIVENRSATPEFEELIAILRQFREIRERESLREKRNAVNVAREILRRGIGVTDGAKQLVPVESGLQKEERELFAIFLKLADETQSHPEGPVRKYWNADALSRKDTEYAQLESDAWPDVEIACRTIIDRWAAV